MEVSRLGRCNVVVAKLNILVLPSILVCRFKHEANSTISLRVSQSMLTNVFIRIFLGFSIYYKFHSLVCDINIGYIRLVALVIVVLVFSCRHFSSQLSLVVKDLVQGTILQIRVNRLPLTSIVRQGPILDGTVFKVAVLDCLIVFFFLGCNLRSLLVSCLLESL